MEKRPVVLVVMDGVGLSDKTLGNAVKMAYKPTLDKLWNECPHTELRAHGLAVGLPTDSDMGNSEVGHNAIGCGQIYSQGAKLVNENIDMERTRGRRKRSYDAFHRAPFRRKRTLSYPASGSFDQGSERRRCKKGARARSA